MTNKAQSSKTWREMDSEESVSDPPPENEFSDSKLKPPEGG